MNQAWISHPLVLRGHGIELRPLEIALLDDLYRVACNPIMWEQTSVDYSVRDNFYPNFVAALKARDAGTAYPFMILDQRRSRIAGTTRLTEIFPEDKKLEIGVTWIDPAYWGTGLNTICKFLLLEYCFEDLAAIRVQFRTKQGNSRSRAALQKIGARFEGIMRNDKIEPDGNSRSTAFYSILGDEWPEVRTMLLERMRPPGPAAGDA